MKGNIKLIYGDCMQLIKSIKTESVSCIVTDPPYQITPKGHAGNTGGMLRKKINCIGRVFEHNNCHIKDWCPELYRVLKDGGHAYIMTNHKNLIEYLNVATECGFHFIKSLIWDKGNKIMGQYYMSQFEYVLFFRKGRGVKINNCGTSDILHFQNIKTKDENGNNLHDTEKPVELFKVLIENSSSKGDLILDPFMGIGASAVAAKQTDRNFVGFEIDKKYFDVVVKRVNEDEKQVKLF